MFFLGPELQHTLGVIAGVLEQAVRLATLLKDYVALPQMSGGVPEQAHAPLERCVSAIARIVAAQDGKLQPALATSVWRILARLLTLPTSDPEESVCYLGTLSSADAPFNCNAAHLTVHVAQHEHRPESMSSAVCSAVASARACCALQDHWRRCLMAHWPPAAGCSCRGP